MHAALRLDHRQQQTLSPRLQHAVRLLQMSSVDFAQEVHQVLRLNPFLEQEETDPEADETMIATPLGAVPEILPSEYEIDAVSDAATSAQAQDSSDERDSEIENDGDGDNGADADEDLATERDTWLADGSMPARHVDDGQVSALDLMPVRTGLRAHLHSQLNVLQIEPRDLLLAKAVVESLDDDGYLRQPLDDLLLDLQLDTGIDPPPTADELRIALRRVQSLDPAGVGACSVAECLLLQLPEIVCPDLRATAQTIVEHHLMSLAARDVVCLARVLGRPAAHIEAACERIRRLDPRPGWQFDASHTHYVTPDIVVKRVRGQWAAVLNPSIVPRVRMNHVYAEMFQRHRNAQNTELAAHLQEARWTVRNVEQRFATILSVSQSIVRHQRRFFELGTLAMKPLGLREIADEVGLHVSTVSRVTNNKFMATPLGLFELKYFFSRAMTATSGHAYSGTAIRGLIKDMIGGEKPSAPMSDAQIARLLAQQGLAVARRTVTKYRQALRIEAVERRRVHA